MKRLGKEMDQVLLAIRLDGIKKYLTGTRQKNYIVSSKSKQKIDCWDRICDVRGEPERITELKHDIDDY